MVVPFHKDQAVLVEIIGSRLDARENSAIQALCWLTGDEVAICQQRIGSTLERKTVRFTVADMTTAEKLRKALETQGFMLTFPTPEDGQASEDKQAPAWTKPWISLLLPPLFPMPSSSASVSRKAAST